MLECIISDNVEKANGIPIPLIRTFEPPARVYKKCIGGVIVTATIPADAQVRGRPGGKCRASKAKIVEILGDLAGEKVGVSQFDHTTMYFAGDTIEVDHFDLSDEECSAGFHFYCSLQEAVTY